MISWLMEQGRSSRCSRMSQKSAAKEMPSDGAGGGGQGGARAHIAGDEGLLPQLQLRSRPMVAQLDLLTSTKANAQAVANVVLPAGQLVALKRVCSNDAHLLVGLGFH